MQRQWLGGPEFRQKFSLFFSIAIFAQNQSMIQRIQTIYLLLAAIASAAVFRLPFASINQIDVPSALFGDGSYTVYDNFGLELIFAAMGLIAATGIFCFKNRKLQIKLASWGSAISVVSFALMAIIFTQDSWSITNFNSVKDELGLGLPVFTFLFFLMARYNTIKDERKVQSMDRLR